MNPLLIVYKLILQSFIRVNSWLKNILVSTYILMKFFNSIYINYQVYIHLKRI